MQKVRISPKFQVVIPKEVREHLKMKVGQDLSCLAKGGIVYLIPIRPLSEMRGFIKAPFSLEGLREKKDRGI